MALPPIALTIARPVLGVCVPLGIMAAVAPWVPLGPLGSTLVALAAVALTWDTAARGWAALIPEGRTLYLRTLDAELNLRGERQLVWQVTPSPSTAGS